MTLGAGLLSSPEVSADRHVTEELSSGKDSAYRYGVNEAARVADLRPDDVARLLAQQASANE